MTTELGFDLAVIIAAQEIVKQPTTSFSWSDVGDTIVQHLKGTKTAEEALEQLRCLAEDYAKRREREALK